MKKKIDGIELLLKAAQLVEEKEQRRNQQTKQYKELTKNRQTEKTQKEAAILYAKIKKANPKTRLTIPGNNLKEKNAFITIARRAIVQSQKKHKKGKTRVHKKPVKSKYLPYVVKNKNDDRWSCALCLKEKPESKKRLKTLKAPGDICRHLRDVHEIVLGYRKLNKVRSTYPHLRRTENGQYRCLDCNFTNGDPRTVEIHAKKKHEKQKQSKPKKRKRQRYWEKGLPIKKRQKVTHYQQDQ